VYGSVPTDRRAYAMLRPISALLIDDDIWSLRLLKGMLEQCFPDLRIETRTEPDASGSFDIYFIDNLIGERFMAEPLAREIRASNPDALVIAFSATLDRETLKSLLRAGCNGACDKTIPSDLPITMEITQRYIESILSSPAREGRGLRGVVGSIRGLLREWNARLEYESSQI
jgi:DNA-binding NarL/FixJ family response regulator